MKFMDNLNKQVNGNFLKDLDKKMFSKKDNNYLLNINIGEIEYENKK